MGKPIEVEANRARFLKKLQPRIPTVLTQSGEYILSENDFGTEIIIDAAGEDIGIRLLSDFSSEYSGSIRISLANPKAFNDFYITLARFVVNLDDPTNNFIATTVINLNDYQSLGLELIYDAEGDKFYGRRIYPFSTGAIRTNPGGGVFVSSPYLGQANEVFNSSGVSLSNDTPATVCTLVLAPGVWLAYCSILFEENNATVTHRAAGLYTEVIEPDGIFGTHNDDQTVTLTSKRTLVLTPGVVDTSTTLSLYLNAYASFSAGTILAKGQANAIRIR